MFAVVYRWKVKNGREREFKEAWFALTRQIARRFGAWGSRLHRADDGSWVAYAQWPNRELWEAAGKLPQMDTPARRAVAETTETVETLFRLDMISDLLQPLAPTNSLPKLSLRDGSEADVSIIADYWRAQTSQDLERMKIDPTKRPSEAQEVEEVRKNANTPDTQKKWHRLIWELDGKPVGMATVRNVRFADQAEIHLHIFSSSNRMQGLGTRFFASSLAEFSRRFRLKTVICEPSSSNPAPNKLLQGLGLEVAKTYCTRPSFVSLEHEVNRYEINPEFFQLDLRSDFLNS